MTSLPGVVVRADEVPAQRPPLARPGATNWVPVMDWCRRHPGEGRRFVSIYASAPYKLRKRHPDMTIISKDFRFENGSRVCDMWIVYEPDAGS